MTRFYTDIPGCLISFYTDNPGCESKYTGNTMGTALTGMVRLRGIIR